jgi:hypothetical protein
MATTLNNTSEYQAESTYPSQNFSTDVVTRQLPTSVSGPSRRPVAQPLDSAQQAVPGLLLPAPEPSTTPSPPIEKRKERSQDDYLVDKTRLGLKVFYEPPNSADGKADNVLVE